MILIVKYVVTDSRISGAAWAFAAPFSRRRARGELLERLDEVRDLERLVEVAGVELGEGGELQGLVAESRDHEHGEIGVLDLDDLENLEPVDVGHEDVGHEVVVRDRLSRGPC